MGVFRRFSSRNDLAFTFYDLQPTLLMPNSVSYLLE